MRSMMGIIALGIVVTLAGTPAEARSGKKCLAIADAADRLACYDAANGGGHAAAAASPVPQSIPASQPVASAPALAPAPLPPAAHLASREDLKARSDFDSTLAQVVPLRHGYFRLQLADGSAYETTEVALPPEAGIPVHVRRTFVGTTYLDIKGQSPITIRLARRQ